MANLKSQHFVPKCYLRNFSSDPERRSINLLNLGSGLEIRKASIKGQCAKNFFYGKDLIIEQYLQSIEGKYAEVSRRIVSRELLSTTDIEFLRNFSLLQFLRTDIAIKRQAMAMREMEDLVFENSPDQKPDKPFNVLKVALEAYEYGGQYLSDLRSVILQNETRTPFLSSDDPSVDFNKFYRQRISSTRSFGFQSSGYCLYLPISPNFSFLSYDSNVYSVDRNGSYFALRRSKDVDILNKYVSMKCQNNIYFSEFNSLDYVRKIYAEVLPSRNDSWHRLHYAVLDDETESGGSKRYKVVHTKEERDKSTESMIHIEKLSIEPDEWPSFLKYRAKPQFIDTKSGMGVVRPKIPDLEQDVRRKRWLRSQERKYARG